MNEYNDPFPYDVLSAQQGLVDEFRKQYPGATQTEITAFALGAIKMGSYAIKRYVAGESI